MTQVDPVSASYGVNATLNQQQAKQAALLEEEATGVSNSSIANALAVPLQTESGALSVVQQYVSVAGNVLATSQQALSSVSNTLTAALATASEALSAPASVRPILAQQYNALLAQTGNYVAGATINGINLVSPNATAMTVNTTTQGGKITVNAAPSDAASLGVTQTGASGWTSTAAIESSINQIQSALNQVTSSQSSFAAAQTALQAAAQVNQSTQLALQQSQAAVSGADIGAVAAGSSTSKAQSELAAAASEQQNKQTEDVLELFKK